MRLYGRGIQQYNLVIKMASKKKLMLSQITHCKQCDALQKSILYCYSHHYYFAIIFDYTYNTDCIYFNGESITVNKPFNLHY